MQDANNKRKKLKRSNQGFTLIEMLITTLIMGLVTVMIASSIQAAFQVYTRSTQASEAQVLCDTLVTAVQDELRYATAVRENGAGTGNFTYTSRAKSYGTGCELKTGTAGTGGEDHTGHLVVEKGGSEFELVPGSTYNNSLTARFETLTLDTTDKLINVKIVVSDQDGHDLASQEFAVKPLNGVE